MLTKCVIVTEVNYALAYFHKKRTHYFYVFRYCRILFSFVKVMPAQVANTILGAPLFVACLDKRIVHQNM